MVSIDEALRTVSSGKPRETDPVDTPVYLLICEALFHIANTPNPKIRGSMRRASAAQKMILDRMVGKRMPGSNPAVVGDTGVHFVDLTLPALGEANETGDSES